MYSKSFLKNQCCKLVLFIDRLRILFHTKLCNGWDVSTLAPLISALRYLVDKFLIFGLE